VSEEFDNLCVREDIKKVEGKTPNKNIMQNKEINVQASRFHDNSPDIRVSCPIESSPVINTRKKLAQQEAFLRRGKSKYIGQGISIDMEEAVPNSPYIEKYRNMFYCSSIMERKDGKIVATYCNCRLCPICGRIRTATMMNGYGDYLLTRKQQKEKRQYYLDRLKKKIKACTKPKQWKYLNEKGKKIEGCIKAKEWEYLNEEYKRLKNKPYVTPMKNPYFVTLTTRNTDVIGLGALIGRRRAHDRALSKLINSGTRRRKGFRGVYNKETTARPGNRFHDHIHVMIDGKKNAEWMIKAWIKHWGDMTTREAQDMRKADAGAYKEIFKYMTKLTATTEKKVDNGLDYWEDEELFKPVEDAKKVPMYQLDIILRASEGRIMIRAFGGIKKIKDSDYELENLISQKAGDEIKGNKWRWTGRDWMETTTGELLTGYTPDRYAWGLWKRGEQECIKRLKRETEQRERLRETHIEMNLWEMSG